MKFKTLVSVILQLLKLHFNATYIPDVVNYREVDFLTYNSPSVQYHMYSPFIDGDENDYLHDCTCEMNGPVLNSDEFQWLFVLENNFNHIHESTDH